MSARTPGCDLDGTKAQEIFSSTVKLAESGPKQLWKLTKVTKNNYTSDWAGVMRAYDTINAILIATKGFIPRQTVLQKHFSTWLASQSIEWSPIDKDQAVCNLRLMMSTLLDRKRRRQAAPKQYSRLVILMDMLRSNTDETSPTTPKGPTRIRGKQSVAVVLPEVPKDVEVVEIVDTDDDGGDYSHLHNIFPSKPAASKVSTGASSSTSLPIDASQLAEMTKDSVPGPSPAEYREKPSTDVGGAPKHDAEGVEEPDTKRMKFDFSIYLNKPGVSRDVLWNQVYTRAYRAQQKSCTKQGKTKEQASMAAKEFAKEEVKRWLQAYEQR